MDEDAVLKNYFNFIDKIVEKEQSRFDSMVNNIKVKKISETKKFQLISKALKKKKNQNTE
jgi:hypothetical protein